MTMHLGKHLAVCAILIAINVVVTAGKRRHKIVTYWGQNAVYNSKKERQYWEKDLIDFCRDYNYDVIALSFLNVFFDRKNKDNFPGFNFAFHCETPISKEYPKMFRCPKIEAGIKECQKNGKQVLMSLGGAVGRAGFASPDEATLFAKRIYNLLLDGKDMPNLRPFGSAVLDGVDLDIENGYYQHYDVFVKELKSLSKSRNVLVGAAPQCPYPDRLLGPSPGRVLHEAPTFVDEIYIQFYNNWCHTGNKRVFWDHVDKWMKYAEKHNGPMIYVGVPANTRASGNPQHYRPPHELVEIYEKLKNKPLFGGFMFWDASFDQNNVINGKHFSEHIADIFDNAGTIPTPPPRTHPPSTKAPVTDKVDTNNPPMITTAKPPNPNCKDEIPRACAGWVKECKFNTAVRKQCKKTCKVC